MIKHFIFFSLCALSLPAFAAQLPVVSSVGQNDLLPVIVGGHATAQANFAQPSQITAAAGLPVDIRAVPYGAVCDGVTNVAAAVNAAVAAGVRAILLPANCLYIPTSNTTPSDVAIIGENAVTSVITTSSPTTLNVNIGARGSIHNVDIIGAFCYNGVGSANAARRCPLVGYEYNSEDVAGVANVYPGDSFYVRAGDVTYNGVTTTSGSGPRALVGFCNDSGDCLYTSMTSGANSDDWRSVNGVDGQTMIHFQETNDAYPVTWQAYKGRGSAENPAAILNADHIHDIDTFGYLNGAWQQAADVSIQVANLTGSVFGAKYHLALANSSGVLIDSIDIDPSNSNVGSFKISGHKTMDFSGNLYTQGYTVATLPTSGQSTIGERAYVTDADSCTFLGAVAHTSGALFCPVVYNGSAWVGG